ncbi:DUF4112 domain-containing protein [Sphingobium yanoikuyae]|uniref:DUF4112 domain-containing protein n=1 Tax=Sphingobium yanoikuyae ATCC 51230 TaxID=883163 RepID=K9D9D7_SPHYA|nr:DUF4112 domain-containing protein [Sphingobium yanoikuyae]EKU75532.1 hypothetical protein HMPREF9718_03060 [Sphingobium yanoikuyae ATCC 51230]WQE07403.1 DUF4112 domain-containing protein [Sphingobium yanoikuyae]
MPVSAKQFDDLVRDMPGFGRDPASIRRRIEMMEAVLEGLFVIPGTKRRVGMDSLIGLVPIVGDIATAAMGAWIVWEARNLGLSKWQLTRMAANVGVDTLVGAIPFAGDIFDFLYKSNTKNLRIIRKHLDRHHPSTVTIDG